MSGAVLGQLYVVLLAQTEEAEIPILTPGESYENLHADKQLIFFLSDIEATIKRVDYTAYRKLVIHLNLLVGLHTVELFDLRLCSKAVIYKERCLEAMTRFEEVLPLCPFFHASEGQRVRPICDKIKTVALSHIQLLFGRA